MPPGIATEPAAPPPLKPWLTRGRAAALGTAALVLGIGVPSLGFYARHAFLAPGPAADAHAVVIPRGGAERVAETLVDAGLVQRRWEFLVASWATRGEGTLHAAELAFPAHASLRDVLTILRTAKPVQHAVVIPEGLTAQQIAAIIDRADAMTGHIEAPPEGSVLPQTYSYEFGASRAALVERAQAAMDRALAELWAERDGNLPFATPEEALTLASIVERETSRPDERPHVASVYINRLRLGMKLQADPTVAYAAANGAGPLDRRLSRADLDRDAPYNTYRNRGLPPGPIASPGVASLRAVMHPAVTDDLYFVADGSGGHAFARTREEHQHNVLRWRALLSAPPPG